MNVACLVTGLWNWLYLKNELVGNKLVFCMLVQVLESKKLIQWFLSGHGQRWPSSFSSGDLKNEFMNWANFLSDWYRTFWLLNARCPLQLYFLFLSMISSIFLSQLIIFLKICVLKEITLNVAWFLHSKYLVNTVFTVYTWSVYNLWEAVCQRKLSEWWQVFNFKVTCNLILNKQNRLCLTSLVKPVRSN